MSPVAYPDRVIYPVAGFRKRDVVDYYQRIAPVLLPHLENRPVTLKRYPDQAQGEFFYEKDAPAFTPKWVETFGVWRRSGESQIHYIVIRDARTLLWAAGVGTLEIHPFLARTSDFSSPTHVVFDLDPGEGSDILACARVAFLLRDLLARLGLRSCAKVSGSKGLQVYVPVNTSTSYTATQAFSRAVAEFVAGEHPREVTAIMEKAQRKNKVFIDWSQNADYKTTVGVYSLRAKRGHPYVSAPVSWDELQRAVRDRNPDLLYFLPDAVLERVRKYGDLFAPVETLVQNLPEHFLSKLHISRTVKSAARKTVRRAPPDRSSRASEQGGRRVFTARRTNAGISLVLQLHERKRAWTFLKLPARAGESQPATPSGATPAGTEWDSGVVELIEGNPAKGYLDLYFSGTRITGEYILRGDGAWEIIRPQPKKRYAPAAFLEGVKQRPPKVRTDEAAKIKTKNDSDPRAAPPKFVAPMECLLVDRIPENPPWIYELKLDGYRIVSVKHGARATLYSRRGTPFNDRFPEIAEALRRAPLPDCVLDGEVVALDEHGRPSFQELQNSRTSSAPIVYYVFDLLHLGGHDLTRLPLNERKRRLRGVARSFTEPVRMAEVLDSDAASLLAQVKRLGLEGILAKRADSPYESGRRSGAWVKYRVNEREEFVIGGYLPGRTGLDALLVGRERAGKLYFTKKVRNGFVPASRRVVLNAISRLKTRRCPFVNLPEPSSRRGAVDAEEMRECVWVRPERRAEIEFAEKTAGGRLRHAAFRQLVDEQQS